jgi:hypothetical protein
VWAIPPRAALSTPATKIAEELEAITSVSGTSRELWFTTLDGRVGTIRPA